MHGARDMEIKETHLSELYADDVALLVGGIGSAEVISNCVYSQETFVFEKYYDVIARLI